MSQSLHPNHQFLCRQVSFVVGAALDVGFASGDGSTQISPNQFLEVHVWDRVVEGELEVIGEGDEEGRDGADVMG